MQRLLLASFLVAAVAACNDNNPTTPADMAPSVDMVNPFMQRPECMPSLAVTPMKGDRQVLISQLRIADAVEGFDLNGDGKPDNKLSLLGPLAKPGIDAAFQQDHTAVIPIELFGYSGMDSACTKFALYVGRILEDKDDDHHTTSWTAGKADCDDTDPNSNPGAPEVVGDRVDNDCDGYADNAKKGSPPTDTQDLDGDGYTLAMGDCDDRPNNPMAAMRHPKAKDLCGDGIDQDCDGIPDNDPSCNPFSDNKVPVHVTALSFTNAPAMSTDMGMSSALFDDTPIDPTGLVPAIAFKDGAVKGGTLNAGPDRFQLSVPIGDNGLTLTLDGTHVAMQLVDMPDGTYVKGNVPVSGHVIQGYGGAIGGVLETVTLAGIKDIPGAGAILKQGQSLADAIYVGPGAAIIGLDSDDQGHYEPDIDVDGDGLEAFWEEGKPANGVDVIDHCKDGDGTVVTNNFDGNGTSCVFAKDAKGNYRFVDGLSVALKFNAVPVVLKDVVSR